MPSLRLGDHGAAVAEIRGILVDLGYVESTGHLPSSPTVNGWSLPEAVFDEGIDHAVRAFQQERGLLVDGIVGAATYRTLREASYRLGARTLLFRLSAPMHGDDVATLQARLQNLGYYTGMVDGHFGDQTHGALANYQREFGLVADGVCGPGTLRSLQLLGTRVTGGSPHAIREEEHVRDSGPQLSGKRIVIDPGGGDQDSELAAVESQLLWDLAERLEGRMAAAGMQTFRSRGVDQAPTDAERAEIANGFDADVVIALRMGRYRNEHARGVASFHFGNSHGSVSTIGRSLANFIQREIVARTALPDCKSHGRTWDILRLTRMPTVEVDVGYVTSPEDVAALEDPLYRDTVAEAILIAVKRLYLLGKDDQPTGTYTFAELLAAEDVSR